MLIAEIGQKLSLDSRYGVENGHEIDCQEMSG